MKRSKPAKHARPRFGRHQYTIGATQNGDDLRQSRAAMIAIVAQRAGTPAAQLRIMARRIATGKSV